MSEQKKFKILIVEDEVPLLEVVCDKLRQEGYEVLKAKNGNEGIKLALDEHPDLILLDIVMPYLDGIAAIQQIKNDEWGRDAKIIFLTNLNMSEDIVDVRKYGITDYLVKSNCKLEDVCRKVNEVLNAEEVDENNSEV